MADSHLVRLFHTVALAGLHSLRSKRIPATAQLAHAITSSYRDNLTATILILWLIWSILFGYGRPTSTSY